MDRLKILITGGNGYIAKSLYNSLKEKHNITIVSRDNFDLTNSDATRIFFQHRLFDVVIHCAVRGGSRLKVEDSTVLDDNLRMYYNLLDNHTHFDKLIHFGSGADTYMRDTPYGLSKHTIRQSIMGKDNFYNLRVFAVFDENELDTRFIKANVKRYINNKPIEIDQDRYMSFFYMEDLVRVVDYYICEANPQKELDCVYSHIHTLGSIANIINDLDTHKVDVLVHKEGIGSIYYGENLWRPNIEYLGLEHGIKQTYNKLK